jgi:signal transduction histidine kinase/CheY-like chemotaxis protein
VTAAGSPSERVLILAPGGRDAAIAAKILQEAGVPPKICADLPELCASLNEGAAAAIMVEEALADASQLSQWVKCQQPWSDFPFIMLTPRGGGVERNPAAGRLLAILGNVSFLERPFHPTTLISVVKTAYRGRLRQYEARERIEEIRRAEALLERRVEERTAELAAANRQLASQIAEREKAESALRQSQRLEAVGQLTSGVAHDFNNLLTVILGNVRQLQKTATDAGQIRRLNMMAEAAERGAKLTAQMLAFSRRQKLEPKPVDLNETVANMRDLLQSTMGGSVRIETVLAGELWPAMIDPTQIELAILNLAINARDAMAVGGTLAVETSNAVLGEPRSASEPPPGEYVCVAVSDTGSGMPDHVLAKVFEPFFTTKEVGKGSGLGLSQVLGLAKQLGGGVRIQTRVGEGTSVKLYLPRANGKTAIEPSPRPAVHAPRPSGHTVLLVDDDSAVREVTGSILQDLGYHVIEAGSGGACLDMLDRRTDIDVILLDFAMPGMNGAEVAREIRSRLPTMPILFATGYAAVDALMEASEDNIVRKPFVEAELADKLRRALGLAPSDAEIIPLRARSGPP